MDVCSDDCVDDCSAVFISVCWRKTRLMKRLTGGFFYLSDTNFSFCL